MRVRVSVLVFSDGDHTAVGHLTDDMLELNGGVVDVEAFVKIFSHMLQDAVAGRERQVGDEDVAGERVRL